MQRKQALLLVGFYHFNDSWKELTKISDSNIARGECSSGAHIFLIGSEVIDNELE